MYVSFWDLQITWWIAIDCTGTVGDFDLIPVWARGRCRISPPRFLAECCKRHLNQVSLFLLYFRLSAFSDLYWVCLSVFSCTVLFVSISQVIGCEDRLRNDLYCVGWGVKLYSNQSCERTEQASALALVTVCVSYNSVIFCIFILKPPSLLFPWSNCLFLMFTFLYFYTKNHRLYCFLEATAYFSCSRVMSPYWTSACPVCLLAYFSNCIFQKRQCQTWHVAYILL